MAYNSVLGNEHFFDNLEESFNDAKSIDIIVSFLRESGVKLLRKELAKLADKNIRIRILTGNYLNITEPSALYLLKDILGENLDLRFFADSSRSFHPKAYIFNYEYDSELYIGSSNISKSALTVGFEWNYRLVKSDNSTDFNRFLGEFEDIFLNQAIKVDNDELRRYAKTWKKPKLASGPSIKETRKKALDNDRVAEEGEAYKVKDLYEPRGAQIEALYELKCSREYGYDKGLVVAATGVGKTYLAAFDSIDFDKILFVAHREEILKQAERSFKNVRSDKTSGFFSGDSKSTDADMIFATVQTLGKEEYLDDRYFKRDAFDYIVVDEFHHSVAPNYRRLIDYFSPKYMLGLTATPERLDNKDVFSVCDYNKVYEIRLKEAIDRGLLVPFRYYGIYDESVDYGQIDIKNGSYNISELEESLMINKRAELILNHYRKYNSKRAIGFCSSRKHAEYMADYFSKNGIVSVVVISNSTGKYAMERSKAIDKLTRGEIAIIFSVDILNEGVDIPALDMLLFLRPTESPTVFLQQLGRGLRKYRDKKYLNVLDFIGNFKRANFLPLLLTGKSESNHKGIRHIKEEEYPEDCLVDFDFRSIDLFKEMEKSELRLDELITNEYYRIKEDLGHRPSRLDLFTYMDDSIYQNMRNNREKNILRDYIGFLKREGELKNEESILLEDIAHKFLKTLENTLMTKLYKMPLLLSLYNDGDMKMSVKDSEVVKEFESFYGKPSNKVDLKSIKIIDIDNISEAGYLRMIKNPKEAFAKSNSEFFYNQADEFGLDSSLEKYIVNSGFQRHFKDIVDYRVKRFYKERLEKKEFI